MRHARRTALLLSLATLVAITGPASAQVFVRPGPVIVQPAPVFMTPAPVFVTPTPVVVSPAWGPRPYRGFVYRPAVRGGWYAGRRGGWYAGPRGGMVVGPRGGVVARRW